MAILVFGNLQDLHVSSVCRALQIHFDVPIYSIDHTLPSSVAFECSTSGGVSVSCKEIDFDALCLVWDRSKLTIPLNGKGETYRSDFVRRDQWIGLYRGLAEVLGLRVINKPTSGLFSKLSQLKVAQSCGFKIPHTIIPASKRKMVSESARRAFIVKAIAHPNTPSGDQSGSVKAIMTTRVHPEELAGIDEAQLLVCQHLFQEEISKKCELRVIATRQRYYAFSTTAHRDELTTVDWRYGNTFVDFAECELSDALYGRIRDYLGQMGLIYGVFDIVVDENGNEWFLECNIEGQWYWLERQCGVSISYGVAEALARADGKNGGRTNGDHSYYGRSLADGQCSGDA